MSIEPVVCDVWVAADREAAFRRFTAELASWWPGTTHSISRDGYAAVSLEGRVGGRVVETDVRGATYEWGRVRVWDPPARFVTSWHPGRPPAQAQEVEVAFVSEKGGTRVRLTHRNWEVLGDGAADARADYAGGWVGVLDTYAGSLGASTGEQG